MSKGGKRAGAGRRRGSVNKATLAKRVIAESGRAPLDVMLENMRFAHEEAAEILAQIVEGDMDGTEGFDLFKQLMSLRSTAQDCARDAAPYLHPKLSTIEHNSGKDGFQVVVRQF